MASPDEPQRLTIGAHLTLEGRLYQLINPLTQDGRGWRVDEVSVLELEPAVSRWLWLGPRDATDGEAWQQHLERLLTARARRDTLPLFELASHANGRHVAVVQPHTQDSRAFDELQWRALPPLRAMDAVLELITDLDLLHSLHLSLGGLRREQLRWDEARGRLLLASMPGLRAWRDEVEERWRDIKLVGELLFENLLSRPCPNGHELAALLQSPPRMREVGLNQPGLVQVLAGCVTPYGDLAYQSISELRGALLHLRTELDSPLSFEVASCSTMGTYLFRKNNQDSCGHVALQSTCASRQVSTLFACVADGIGGIADGERASALAVHVGCEAFVRDWSHAGVEELREAPVAHARAIVKVVSQRLALAGEFDPQDNRGGTTYSAVLIADGMLGLAHVGDSRVYLLREDRIIRLTEDHNLAAILEELGELTEDGPKSREAGERTISRFLSTGMELELDRVDTFSAEAAQQLEHDELELITRGLALQEGDRLLLTSDGAHGVMRDEEILEAHRAARSAKSMSQAIVTLALSRSSKDNVTALTIDVMR